MAGHMAYRRMSRQLQRTATGLSTIQDSGMSADLKGILVRGEAAKLARIDTIDFDVYTTDDEGNTVLLVACQCKDGDKRRATVKLLISAFKAQETIGTESKAGESALMVACRIGDRKLAEILLGAGANPDFVSSEDQRFTPLACALCGVGGFGNSGDDAGDDEDRLACARLLLQSGAQATAATPLPDLDEQGQLIGYGRGTRITPLMRMCQLGDVHGVQLLLSRLEAARRPSQQPIHTPMEPEEKKGGGEGGPSSLLKSATGSSKKGGPPPIEAVADNGFTALLFCWRHNQADCAKELLRAGARWRGAAVGGTGGGVYGGSSGGSSGAGAASFSFVASDAWDEAGGWFRDVEEDMRHDMAMSHRDGVCSRPGGGAGGDIGGGGRGCFG
eukprot:g6003.t1